MNRGKKFAHSKARLSKQHLTKLYEQFIPLCHDLGARFAKTYGLPTSELIAEALSIWGVAVAEWPWTYDKRKSAASSWAYKQVYYRLLDYCTRKAPKETTFTKLGDAAPLHVARKSSWIESLFRTLSEDARIIVSTLLFAPAEIAEKIAPVVWSPHHGTFAAIQDYMEDILDWPRRRFEYAWDELDDAVWSHDGR